MLLFFRFPHIRNGNLAQQKYLNNFICNRTMAVSLTMMVGRVGSLIGNILFPLFLEYGCSVALSLLTGLVSGNYFDKRKSNKNKNN